MDTNNTLVVGYDGSDDGDRALSAGVDWATLHGWTLEVLIAQGDLGHSAWGTDWCRELGREWASRAEKELAGLGHANTAIHTLDGHATPLLIEASRNARLVVLGANGHGLISSGLVGSVSQHVARHAHCPVLVARPTPPQASGVVVGFDGSEQSRRALEFALEHAALRGVAVDVLHIPAYFGAWGYDVAVPAVTLLELRAMDEGMLADAQQIADTKPDVPVTVRLVEGRPAAQLVKAARHAELVVVGSRGVGPFRELLLGSVSSGVLHHADTNVAVVR